MWILHVDLDEFLAAVEKRRNPELIGTPVVVGGSGDPTQRRMVVASASYEARAFGVHAGMPLRAALKKCPDAAFLPSDRPVYEAASAEVMDSLRGFGFPVEVWGWDEAFVGADVADPEALAVDIRAKVLADTRLSCAVGVGDNKLRAKMATGFAKPGGIHRLTADDWMTVLGDRPTHELWGIGAKTSKKLAEHAMTTVAELAAADPHDLAQLFGPTTGPWLSRIGRGEGDTTLVTEPRVARGRSKSTTFADDLTDRADIDARVAELARDVAEEVIGAGRVVERVAVTVRTASFFTRTKISKLAAATTDVDVVVHGALAVLDRFELDRPVRLLGVRLELQDL
ncbi:DNA polymerase IV [Antrihabitans cavernicola]|uniref:DNA polymerase IV n=1 Tax=Antrihabitans cavernicola TaxID=2495913 RepID=A0A5A7S7S4_9NOCA|nr:DNA polymerase IV [Spelaeibacter cavernicola]KAA0021249.1 DNA polymerase IV [Spelaeibacter cavernicola]